MFPDGQARGRPEPRWKWNCRWRTQDFDALWALTEGKRLRKTRYDIPWHGGRTVELDVYAGRLEGLWVAEVEFDDEASARAFEPPEFFGREITGDPAYRNEKLAREGLTKADEG